MRFLVVVVTLALVCAATAFAGPPVYIPPPPPKPAEPAEPPKPEKVRLLVMNLQSSDVDKATVTVLQGIVTTGLSDYPAFDVVSGDDVKQLVNLQAERDTMGCSEAGCLAEIADALGAKLVVFGNVGKLDNSLVLNLNLFDSVKAIGLGRIVIQVESTKSLPKKLKPKLRDLVGKWYAAHNLALPPVVEEKEEPPAAVAQVVDPGPWPWVTTIAGVVLLAGGTAAAVVGALPYSRFLDDKANAIALQSKIEKAGTATATDVTAAKAASADILAARNSWNSYGYLLFDVGAPVAAAGLVATGAGLVWVLTAPAPNEATTPPSTNTSTPAAPVAGGAR